MESDSGPGGMSWEDMRSHAAGVVRKPQASAWRVPQPTPESAAFVAGKRSVLDRYDRNVLAGCSSSHSWLLNSVNSGSKPPNGFEIERSLCTFYQPRGLEPACTCGASIHVSILVDRKRTK